MSYNSFSVDLNSAPENLFVGNVLDLLFLVFCQEIKYDDILQEEHKTL